MARGYLNLLKTNSNYRALFLAMAISLFGDWFSLIAIFTILHETQESHALTAAAVLVIKQLPTFIFGAWAGSLADRVSRPKIMLMSDIGRALATFAMLAAALFGSIPGMFFFLIICAVLSAYFEPARSACMPDIVDQNDLVAANALGGMLWSFMLIAGSGLGGLVTEYLGWKAALGIDAISFVVSAWFVIQIKPQRGPGHSLAIRHEHQPKLLEFLQFAAADPRRAVILSIKSFYCLGGAMYLLYPLLGQEVFRVGATGALGVTIFYFARGAGALTGSLTGRHIFGESHANLRRGILWAFALIVIAFAGLGITSTLFLAVSFVFLAHVGGSIIWIFSNVLIQRDIPTEYRGRAFGLDFGICTLVSSCSSLGFGYALDHGIVSLHQAALAVSCLWLLPLGLWILSQGLWPVDKRIEEHEIGEHEISQHGES